MSRVGLNVRQMCLFTLKRQMDKKNKNNNNSYKVLPENGELPSTLFSFTCTIHTPVLNIFVVARLQEMGRR